MPRQTRSRARNLAVSALRRGMPPGRPRWPPAEPRPRSRASVPGALLVGAQRWPAAGISWRRTRNGQNPRPHRPTLEAVGQTRAGRGGGTHRRRLRRPKGPDVSVLASSVPPHDQLPDPLHGDVQVPPSPDRPAFLERGIDPGDRLLTPLLEPAISTPNCRDKSSTGSPRKSRRATSRLRVTVHRWPRPSGPAGETGPGKTWTSQARPRLPQAHQQQLCSAKLSVMPPWSLRFERNSVSQGNRVRPNTIMTRPSTGSATSSSACFAASRTGAV